MFKVTVGHSCDPDSTAAIQEVVDICQVNLGDVLPCAGILLASPDYEHQLLLDYLDSIFPDLELIGGTTCGEMSSLEGFQLDSLVLILFCSDTIQIQAGVGHHVNPDYQEATHKAVQMAQEKLTQPIQLCLLCPDGLTANGNSIVHNLQTALPDQTPILGGMAGEDLTYNSDNMHQFFKKLVLQNTVPILLFSGEFHFSFGVGCGYQPISTKGIVTSVSGNRIHEIDHKPAELFCRKYWGDLQLHPPDIIGLAVFEDQGDQVYFRSIQKFDEETMDLVSFGDVPLHSSVQLSEATRADILEGTRTSISNAVSSYPSQTPEVLLCFSCGGRRLSLGKKVSQEYEIIKSILPMNISIAGFYVYGEFSPLERKGKSYFHNLTIISMLIGEK